MHTILMNTPYPSYPDELCKLKRDQCYLEINVAYLLWGNWTDCRAPIFLTFIASWVIDWW